MKVKAKTRGYIIILNIFVILRLLQTFHNNTYGI